jgi:hypothetical protein
MNEFATSKEKKTTRKDQIYATSAAGSVAVEGAEEAAPVLGGCIDALAARVKEASVEVEEAADGVIIDTMPGAYFFAFSKKPSSFERGRP